MEIESGIDRIGRTKITSHGIGDRSHGIKKTDKVDSHSGAPPKEAWRKPCGRDTAVGF